MSLALGDEPRPRAFGALLRAHRHTAGLTQEALAERAGLSLRAIQNLERGERRPYPDTAQRLLDALGLSGAARQEFEMAARPLPRVRSATAEVPHNLPRPLTTCIGRADDLAAIRQSVRGGRLVTLVGPGGAGKTRLALEVGLDLVQAHLFADGVWLIELDAVDEPDLVAHVAAAAIGVAEERERPVLVTIAEALRRRDALIVVDNCEHVLGASAHLVETLLARCPTIRVLATSRQPLGLPGEVVRQVGSLDLPGEDAPTASLLRSPCVQLFVERARAAAGEMELTPDVAHEVAAICRRLDGMPLAVELAAARLRGLSVHDLARHLDAPFGLLTGGAHRRMRHQSLRATIDWSYALLDERQRQLARQLSVFGGGWTLLAAEAVCGPLAASGLVALVDHSLVQVDVRQSAGARYRLLEMVRQYLGDQLAAAGEESAARDRHLDYYLAVAEDAEAGLGGADQAIRLRQLDAERANLRSALQWAVGRDDAAAALRLTAALGAYWDLRGERTEGLSWLEQALRRPAPPVASGGAPRARALAAAGRLALGMRNPQAIAWLDESLTLCRAAGDGGGEVRALVQIGRVWVDEANLQLAVAILEDAARRAEVYADTAGLAAALGALGQAYLDRADYASSLPLLERSLQLSRIAGDRGPQAAVLLHLAMARLETGDVRAALATLDEAQGLLLALGDAVGVAWTEHDLARLAFEQGDFERAAALFEHCADLFESLGYGTGVAHSVHNLARSRLAMGSTASAETLFQPGLDLFRRLGHPRGIAWALYNLAWVAARDGEREAAWHWLVEGLGLFRSVALGPGVGACLITAAHLELSDHPLWAARLAGIASTLRLVSVVDRERLQLVARDVRDALGSVVVDAQWSAASELAPADVDLVLDRIVERAASFTTAAPSRA